MCTQGWKVPTALLAAALVGACGGEAESGADAGSERVIPAAEVPQVRGEAGTVDAAETPTAPSEWSGPDGASETSDEAERAAASAPSSDPRQEPVSESPSDPGDEPASRPSIDPSTDPSTDASTDPSTGGPAGPPTPPPAEEVRTAPGSSVAPAEPMEARPESPTPEPLAAPVGTRIELTVEEELSTRASATGDRFRATVAEDVLGADGVVLLPRGTPVRGRVVESFESPSTDRPATLALGVEAVELDGRILPLAATVTELEHETEARDSDGRSAAKVGAGAVAGALLGKIFGGDGEDAVKGAVAGALAGAAVAHATRDGHAVVPAGARVVVVLDERLVVEPAPPVAGR